MPPKLSSPLLWILIGCLTVVIPACKQPQQLAQKLAPTTTPTPTPSVQSLPANASPQLKQLLESAIEQSQITTGYDPSYVKIGYPNGDVSSETGVCSDVIIRAFRKAGIDLQKEVHEDMTKSFGVYPKRWGASGTDTNIDHRRVLNLMTYFERQGKSVGITDNRADYLTGDIVAWELSPGVEHIGLVSNLISDPEQHNLIIHNIGGGVRVADELFGWKIIGHYRYFK
jgi:uncharacterized protein YijF (DUF1287 family)